MYTAVPRGSSTMMKIWLSAVMIILVIIAVDITVIGWDRFVSGIGALVDGYWHAEQVSPDTAQPRTTSPQRELQPWYSFNNLSEQCESDGERTSPAGMMELFISLGRPYTMQDVTERGEIVQTTMVALPTADYPTESRFRWYRGQARCEQAQRPRQQAKEQQLQQLKKYR